MQLDWSVLNNQMFEFVDTADVRAHSPFIMIAIQFSRMHQFKVALFNVAHFNIVSFTVALIISRYRLTLSVSLFSDTVLSVAQPNAEFFLSSYYVLFLENVHFMLH